MVSILAGFLFQVACPWTFWSHLGSPWATVGPCMGSLLARLAAIGPAMGPHRSVLASSGAVVASPLVLRISIWICFCGSFDFAFCKPCGEVFLGYSCPSSTSLGDVGSFCAYMRHLKCFCPARNTPRKVRTWLHFGWQASPWRLNFESMRAGFGEAARRRFT